MFSFPKTSRLLQKTEFATVLRARRTFRNNFFGAHILRNDLGFSRLGLTVSKRTNRHAHQRNAIKRIAREYFRLHQFLWSSTDLVIQSRCAYNRQNRAQFYQALEEIGHFVRNHALR